jgi:hypothetical protein
VWSKFSYNMRFAGGQSAYIRGLQKDESCIGHMRFAVEKTMYIHGSPVR